MRRLLNDIKRTGQNQQMPWSIMGDFNNILSIQKRVEGKTIKEFEFVDFSRMMESI